MSSDPDKARIGDSDGLLLLALAASPTGLGGLLGDLPPARRAEVFRARESSEASERYGSLALALHGDIGFFDLSGCDVHDVDGVGDHLGWTLLTFGAFWHGLAYR